MSGTRLSKVEASRIRSAVDRLPATTRPTWAVVVEIAKETTGRDFTRQALCDHKSIESSYKKRVDAFREARRTGRCKKGDDVESPADRKNRLIKEENDMLRKTIAEYDRRWNAIFAHLHLKGIDVRSLPTSLPPIGREGRQ
ncbi:hypothetical protein [Sphingomonas mollis]|uniref:Transposase n=1 Tax=Sphingomonas mollis TaxID=2795726 RepID=A0ABS0XR59_9SPHN|nr:hypothetical protein [Sphingomonas sp. BT553]MBJ6122532.1 hypothetical protein [Sphingomonas sp. BT553]